MYTSEKRLYLNSDRSRVVEEDDPDAAFVLVGAGGQLSDEDAEKYGLVKAAKGPVEAKVVKGPPATKATRAAEETKE